MKFKFVRQEMVEIQREYSVLYNPFKLGMGMKLLFFAMFGFRTALL